MTTRPDPVFNQGSPPDKTLDERLERREEEFYDEADDAYERHVDRILDREDDHA